MPLPYPTQFVTVGELKTAYIDVGQGVPVILLHGLGGSKYTWRHLIGPLSKKFRVIALDMKGFGESEHHIYNYTLESQTTFLEQFLKTMHISKAHIVGNSMGGATALSVSYFKPELIEKTVLISPAVYGMKLPFWFRLFSIPLLRHILPILDSDLPIRKNFAHAAYDQALLSKENIEEYRRPYHSFWARYTFMEVCSEFAAHPGLMEIFPYVHQPVLVIWGEEDRVIPIRFGERLVRDLPDVRFERLPLCGHIPQEEKPELTVRLIEGFLESS